MSVRLFIKFVAWLITLPIKLLVAGVAAEKAAVEAIEQPKRKRAAVGYYALGMNALDMDTSAMIPALEEKGYPSPTMPVKFMTNGGGGYAFLAENDRLFVGGEGAGGGIADTAGQHATFTGGGLGFANLGYLFRLSESLRIYPLLGVGVGGAGVTVAKPDPESPTKSPRDREKKVGIGGGGMLLHVGFGVELKLGGRNGMILGVRVGYAFHPLKILTFGAGIKMPYIRFIIGGGRFEDQE